MGHAHSVWAPGHFIGGHPALDLANAVFDRRAPAQDRELLHSAHDVGHWLRASGLADEFQADAVTNLVDATFVRRVWEIREATFSIFDALAADQPAPARALGVVFQCAANGLATGTIDPTATRPALTVPEWRDPDAVAAFLAVLSIEAFFILPRDRLRSCPRCGWLFVDTSRGGKRRWCSMRTCGNREKASRHRDHTEVVLQLNPANRG